jgi:hypothetical protein
MKCKTALGLLAVMAFLLMGTTAQGQLFPRAAHDLPAQNEDG